MDNIPPAQPADDASKLSTENDGEIGESFVEFTTPSASPTLAFSSYSEREKYIIKEYKAGKRLIDIAQAVGISETRISQILKKNKHLLNIDRIEEKARRLHRLKLCELKASVNIAPKDADQLVRVLEAQRRELEEKPEDSRPNQQITINNLTIDPKSLPQNDLWDKCRKLIDCDT